MLSKLLADPPKITTHSDDILVHQDRINTIDAIFLRIYDTAQTVWGHTLDSVQEKSPSEEKPKWKEAIEKLVKKIDKARHQASNGEFAWAEKSCQEAWNEWESSYKDFDQEFFNSVDENVFDRKMLKDFFTQYKGFMQGSIEQAISACKDSDIYLNAIKQTADVEIIEVEKALIKEAQGDLHRARESLQQIWDKKESGDIGQAKERVKSALKKCQDLS